MKKYIYLIIFMTNSIITAQNLDLINTSNDIGLEDWRIVNDDVMGGVSSSKLYLNEEQNLVFSGNLSLENNGGFASSRMGFEERNS
jgi:monofunctional biosynthetic peptidoglycan transglycosylase